MREVAAIILAAGRATRFARTPDETKVVAALDGKPLVRHVAEAALASKARPVIVVTGHGAEGVVAALRDVPVRLAHNADFAAGMSTSLRTGIAALPPEQAGALVLLADMPRISPGVIDALIAAFDAAAPRVPLAVVPVHAGRRGNPVLVGRALFPAIMRLEGDHGARGLIETAGEGLLECPIDDPAVTVDIDTRDALNALQASRDGVLRD